jgi:two-component system chemotaxis response regulator CheB
MISSDTLKILVVDDSVVFRKVVRDVLKSLPNVEVIGVAANGQIALEKMEQLAPDLITLDFDMPQLDGLGVLSAIREKRIDVGVIMLSAFTRAGAQLTTTALRQGALDFVLKPDDDSIVNNTKTLRDELAPKIEAFRKRLARTLPSGRPTVTPISPRITSASETMAPRSQRVDVVAIGISTGGPASLMEMLPKLPADFPVPILIVQHLPPMFTATLAADLDRTSPLTVCEVSDGQEIVAGTVYIAPGGRQTKVRRAGDVVVAEVNDDPPVKSCRPSVDYLLNSVGQVWGRNSLALIMTGMGDDGKKGCEQLNRLGAKIVAQDEASCVIYGMPRTVVEAGLAQTVCSLDSIPSVLVRSAAQCRGVIA